MPYALSSCSYHRRANVLPWRKGSRWVQPFIPCYCYLMSSFRILVSGYFCLIQLFTTYEKFCWLYLICIVSFLPFYSSVGIWRYFLTWFFYMFCSEGGCKHRSCACWAGAIPLRSHLILLCVSVFFFPEYLLFPWLSGFLWIPLQC